MITLTREAWKKFAPHCPPNYADALFDNLNLLEEAGILESELRWCHWAATVLHETGDFSEIRENLRYTTCKALKNTWPSRFGHKADEELQPLLKNPRGLAEAVYGGRMGNRPGTSDSYDTRGGGWFNTTGHGIVNGYCEKLGIPYSSGVLDDPLATLRFAILEWTETKCNDWADANDILKVAKAINTGSANSGVAPVGMAERRKAFAKAWSLWGETGKADKPSTSDDVADAAGKVFKKVVAAGATVEGARQVVNASTAPAEKKADAPQAKPTERTAAAISKAQEVRVQVDQGKELFGWAKDLMPGVHPGILVIGLGVAVIGGFLFKKMRA